MNGAITRAQDSNKGCRLWFTSPNPTSKTSLLGTDVLAPHWVDLIDDINTL